MARSGACLLMVARGFTFAMFLTPSTGCRRCSARSVQRPGPTAPGGRQVRFHATAAVARPKEAREVIERVFWYVVTAAGTAAPRAARLRRNQPYADFPSGRFTGAHRCDPQAGHEYFEKTMSRSTVAGKCRQPD